MTHHLHPRGTPVPEVDERMSSPDPAWPSQCLMRDIEAAPMPASVAALLDVSAMRHPQRAFLHFFDDADVITYGEMARLVRRAASALAGCGVGPGSHVVVMVHTCRHYPVSWLALAFLGAVTVPVNHRYTPRELAYMLDDARASHLVIAADLLPVLEAVEGGSPLPRDHVIVAGARCDGYPHHWESLVDRGDSFYRADAAPAPDSLMNIQYTSGTTGLPKGALQTHRYWLTFSRAWTTSSCCRATASAARLGVHGTSARDVASVLAGLLACCSQDHAREDLSAGRQRIVVSSFKPFEDDAPQGLREAIFHFQVMTTRLLNGHLRITRTADGPTREVWEIEDAGRWLW